MSEVGDKTIRDFGDQWSKYADNEGWYASRQLFRDITSTLLDPESLAGKTVADIGSGTGRIVGMLLDAGAAKVYAIEPSSEAFRALEENVSKMARRSDVTCLNERGNTWDLPVSVDYVVSIGVIHHIPEPVPVIDKAFEALKPGGCVFLWLYGHEGNELYLGVIEPIRRITARLPHLVLRAIVEVMYGFLRIYWILGKVVPVPLRSYLKNVLWPMSPQNRRLVIYDQLNPAFAKYYRKHEALSLLETSGFVNLRIHHRHGYSWSVVGQKPFARQEAGGDG